MEGGEGGGDGGDRATRLSLSRLAASKATVSLFRTPGIGARPSTAASCEAFPVFNPLILAWFLTRPPRVRCFDTCNDIAPSESPCLTYAAVQPCLK